MRVLMVSPVGVRGGAEQVLLALAQRLPARGVTPVLACLQPGPLEDAARRQGLEVHAFRPHRFRDMGTVAQGIGWLRGLVRTVKPDLLHANHMAHLYAAPASALSGVPELWHIYDYPYRPDVLGRLAPLLPCRFTIFTTERIASAFPRLRRRPSAVIYPACVDTAALTAFDGAPGVRARLGLPASGPLLVTVARLQAHKGHRVLLDAVPRILTHVPDAHFVVVGKAGDPAQEQYQSELKAQAAKLGIERAVSFTGFVSNSDLYALYREAAALVHPALSEGFGLTLIEAMALNLPVVVAAADGPQEIVGPDGVNGLLVPTGNSAALADATVRVLQNPALAQSLRAAGRERMEAFQVDTMVAQTAEAYQRAVS